MSPPDSISLRHAARDSNHQSPQNTPRSPPIVPDIDSPSLHHDNQRGSYSTTPRRRRLSNDAYPTTGPKSLKIPRRTGERDDLNPKTGLRIAISEATVRAFKSPAGPTIDHVARAITNLGILGAVALVYDDDGRVGPKRLETIVAVLNKVVDTTEMLYSFGVKVWLEARKRQVWLLDPNVGTEENFYKLINKPGLEAMSLGSKTIGRQLGSINTITKSWGPDWKDYFDDRFPKKASEGFLRVLATMARQGWTGDQVWYAMNWAQHFRITCGKVGYNKTPTFSPSDASKAWDKLQEILKEYESPEKVTEASVMKTFWVDNSPNRPPKLGVEFGGWRTHQRVDVSGRVIKDRVIGKISKVKQKSQGRTNESSENGDDDCERCGGGVNERQKVEAREQSDDKGKPKDESEDAVMVLNIFDKEGQKGWNKVIVQPPEWMIHPSEQYQKRINYAQFMVPNHFENGVKLMEDLKILGHTSFPMSLEWHSILDIIDEELQMYRWHLTKGPQDGHLINCFHSLARQLLAQDPLVYALAVAGRQDNGHKFISYPFPPTWVREGDVSAGHTLPCNVQQFLDKEKLKKRDTYRMIFHLDDEIPGTVTEILGGFTGENLGLWQEEVKNRGDSAMLQAPIMMANVYTEEDTKSFGDFTRAPCKRGELRLLSPHIPFGFSKGIVAYSQHRTLSPHYISISNSGYLENNELGVGLGEIAGANRSLVSVSNTPLGTCSGWHIGGYRFPATVELSGIWSIGDALLGYISWDSPAVQRDLERLFITDTISQKRFVADVRKKLERRYKEKMRDVRSAEANLFGDGSFYLNNGREPGPKYHGLVPEDTVVTATTTHNSGAEDLALYHGLQENHTQQKEPCRRQSKVDGLVDGPGGEKSKGVGSKEECGVQSTESGVGKQNLNMEDVAQPFPVRKGIDTEDLAQLPPFATSLSPEHGDEPTISQYATRLLGYVLS